MARGIAVRAINTTEVGIEIVYSAGSPTAPPGPDGSFVFRTQADLQDEIKALETSLTAYQLVLLHLAITWLQPNGSFGNTGQVTNKELRFDTTAAQPLKIV